MSELEELGRYHQLCAALDAALSERNNRLGRVATIAQAASQPPVSRHNIGRRCNFDAAARLFEEARSAEERARQIIAELEQVAPAVGKPLPSLE